ncbi:hypothetical protein PC39_03537 [Salinisphaera sp. PC39]|uniref:hypothetical protein n=1 Tax=Salinisphaera sp. PC39 TaxID=1304156 RepID=UPI00333F06DB
MPDPILIVALLLAAGLFFLGLSGARIRRRRPLAAARSACAGGGCLTLGGLLIAAGLNLYTYARLTYEQPVATVTFEHRGDGRYLARLAQPGKPTRRYELAGDEWQLDARVLKWRAPANLLGLDAQYRLERLSGRYADVVDETSRPRTAHDLADEPGLDVWTLARRHSSWLPLVDASYGSATYLPMADGARFSVSLTQSGLIARAENRAAREAAADW